MLREERPAPREMVVKGVVHEPERARRTEFLNRFHRLRLVAQRADLESQRFHETRDSGVLEHRPESAQRDAQAGLTFAVARADAVVAGDEAHGFGTRGGGGPNEIPRLAFPGIVPCVEPLDLGHAQDAQALLTRHRACLFRSPAVEQRLPQVVANLHTDASEPGGEIDERGIARVGHGHVVQREIDHPVSYLDSVDAYGPGELEVGRIQRGGRRFDPDSFSLHDHERVTEQ